MAFAYGSVATLPYLETVQLDEMTKAALAAVDVDACARVPCRLCVDGRSVTARLHESHRPPSGTLLPAGEGCPPPIAAAYTL